MKFSLKKTIVGTGAALILAGGVAPTAGTVLASSNNEATTSVNETTNRDFSTDIFASEKNESTEINGTTYTYDYTYEDQNRVTYITNENTGEVDKISHEVGASEIYLNGELLATISNQENINESNIAPYAMWSTVSSGSQYITWAQGTTAAVVAGAIATAIGSIGGPAVIAAIGTGALGALAAASSGGTVNYELQRYQPTFGAPQHRYIWSFEAPTGDYYGDYITHV